MSLFPKKVKYPFNLVYYLSYKVSALHYNGNEAKVEKVSKGLLFDTKIMLTPILVTS